eukprot:4319081-Amphidinium_carterae.1
MNLTWDTSQSKQELTKTFTTWRDEIYMHEDGTKPLGTSIKMTILLNRLRGAVRDFLLPTADLQNPDYEKYIKTVEEYYRNVYIDSEQLDLDAFV